MVSIEEFVVLAGRLIQQLPCHCSNKEFLGSRSAQLQQMSALNCLVLSGIQATLFCGLLLRQQQAV